MKNSSLKLPSNKKFGIFFTLVFIMMAVYLYSKNDLFWVKLSLVFAAVMMVVTVFKADALTFLNTLWMRLGFVLGMIASPIALGFIFFGLFSPIALMLRWGRRDELNLKIKKNKSYWVPRTEQLRPGSFEKQF